MNLPNKLTVFRMVLVPFFVAALLWQSFPHHYLVAFLIFAVASYTDHLDGKIARRDNLITNFGKFLDPLADKILVISALVCFVALDLTNVWFVLIIIAREFMVTSIRLIAAEGGLVIAANRWGKAKTISQIVAILMILLLQYIKTLSESTSPVFGWVGEVFVAICTVFTILSGFVYLKQNFSVISQSK